MCGIAGIISKDKIDCSALKRMSDKISHRGPDDEGFFVYGEAVSIPSSGKLEVLKSTSLTNVGLAHRRLSIHDLSDAGHQPMGYMDRYKIVFNGEIYNFLELKDELLLLGYVFNSHTDTEVIMAAYDAWGVGCLSRFNGMWAFMLVDVKLQKLFVSRDRFGVKPLYYYADDENFIFASEIKSIFESGAVKQSLNIGYCLEYLKSGSREWLKECAFENIYRFDFGHYYEGGFDGLFSGNLALNRYWNLNVDTRIEKYSETKLLEYVTKYRGLFSDAVRLRLRADVKVSSSLSGGLDSSSVVKEINTQLKENGSGDKQEVFSSVYVSENTKHCDESVFIDKTCALLAVKSNKIEPDGTGILKEYVKLISHFDTPPMNSVMSSWHTYKLEKEHGITVTLDGQGADEGMAGYGYYFFTHFFNLPYKTLFQELSLCSGENFKYALKGTVFKIIKSVFGLGVCKKVLIALGKDESFLLPLNEKMALDIKEELVGNFHIDDLASMANSIEVRMPFMDYRLIEFLCGVPAVYKIHAGWSKFLGRRAFDGLLPDDIVWRKDKMGWPIPEDYWFKGLHKDWVIDKIKNSKILKLLGYDTMSLVKNFEKTKTAKIMLALNLTVWHELHFEGRL